MQGEAWELCEVRYVPSGGLWKFHHLLEAVATGPGGQRIVTRVKAAAFRRPRDTERDPTFIDARRQVTEAMLRDGWEPLPSIVDSHGVMLPRFRRRLSPPP